MSSICLCFLDGGLEGCMHLVDQLLVLTAGNTFSSKLGSSSSKSCKVCKGSPAQQGGGAVSKLQCIP